MPQKQTIVSHVLANRSLAGTKQEFEEKPQGWLSAAEVMQVLKVSMRQVQRFQTEKRLLHLGAVPRPAKKPLTVYRIDEVMAIKQELDEKRDVDVRNELVLNESKRQVQQRKLDRAAGKRGPGRPAGIETLIQRFFEAAKEAGTQLSPRDKLLLTVEECHAFGFPKDFIYHQVRLKNLVNFGGPGKFLISRYELTRIATGGEWREHNGLQRAHGKLSEEEQKDFIRRAS